MLNKWISTAKCYQYKKENKIEAKERDIMIMMTVIAGTMKKASKMTMKDERKNPLIKKNKVRVEDFVDDDDVDGRNQSEESEIDEKPEKQQKKKSITTYIKQ